MKNKIQIQDITVSLIALGCPKNMVDSEKTLANIGQAGFTLTTDLQSCDVIVINTCGFIESAKQEALTAINDAIEIKAQSPATKIIVMGCLAQRMGKDLFKDTPEIDAVLGLTARDNIVEVIIDLLEKDETICEVSTDQTAIHDDSDRLLTTAGHWAYLRISEGCNRKCTFCTIPDIRGPFRSKPQSDIIKEAQQLADSGVRELILIAQDSSNYGKDLGIKHGLVKLVDQLEQVPSIDWIRIMYLYPANVNQPLINKIASSSKIVNYLDIPIQHINDDILKAMRRTDTKEKTTALIESLRTKIPDAIIRTTVIVGFPGESQEQFDELIDFIKWAKFDMLGAFTYSPEQGTPAALLDNQIPDEIKQQRYETVMQVQQEIAFGKNKARIGQALKCFVDYIDEDGIGEGRFFGQCPEIDGICIIENLTANVSEMIKVEVTDFQDYDLITKQI